MLELDLLPFIQALVSIPFYGGEMNEYIFTAVARGDEAVALRVIEPLHSTGLHTYLFFLIANTAHLLVLLRSGVETSYVKSPGMTMLQACLVQACRMRKC
jgi:hypothetical protein